MGLGNLGGSAQMLFGGSGGQDILQKITSVLGLMYLFGSLILVLMGARQNPLPYIRKNKTTITKKVPMPETQQQAAYMEQENAVPLEETLSADKA